MNLNLARSNMIEQQIRPWDVLDQRVLDVLGDVPREQFLDPAYEGIAYSDHPLPIGHGQFMLPPNVDGRLLQALDLKTTDSVLEIGTGSGFLTLCLARLARHVDSVEINAELHQAALGRLNSLACSNVTARHLDASKEWDADDQYDGIVFTGSLPEVPQFYLDKLAPEGRLVAIIGNPSEATMSAMLMTRVSANEILCDSLFETRADALLNFAPDAKPASAFVF